MRVVLCSRRWGSIVQSSLRTLVRQLSVAVVALALLLLSPTLADANSISQLRSAFWGNVLLSKVGAHAVYLFPGDRSRANLSHRDNARSGPLSSVHNL